MMMFIKLRQQKKFVHAFPFIVLKIGQKYTLISRTVFFCTNLQSR